MGTETSRLRPGSAWTGDRIEAFLREAVIPIRLACLGKGGSPLLCSVWYLHDGDDLWCATQQGASLARLLAKDPRCAFEVAGDQPPYRGVRGQGSASLSRADGPRVLGELMDRYLGGRESGFARWLWSRRDQEVAIRIRWDWITAWDYSGRMSGQGGGEGNPVQR